MINSVSLTTVILLILNGLSIKGQTIDAFIQMAKENNHGLNSLQLSYEAEKEKANQFSDFPDPMISLGIGVLPVETRLGAQRFKIGVSQTLPQKGLLDARKDLQLTKAEVFDQYDKAQIIDISYAIRTAYSTLVYYDNQESIIQKKLELLDDLEELAKSNLKSGKGRLSNILLIERTRELLESDLQLLEKRREIPRFQINRWANRELNTTVELIDKEEVLFTQDKLNSFARMNHPNILILDQKIEISKKTAELTKFEKKPKIGVGLEYALIDKRAGLEIRGNGRDILMPMGSISIPIHSKRFDSKKEEEIIRQQAFESQKEEYQDQFLADIAGAYSKIELSEYEILRIESLKSITRETIELMRTDYILEGIGFEELLRLELEYVQYDFTIASALYSKSLAQATLQKYQ